MPQNAPEYSISTHYDPDDEILSADADPVAAYLTYRAESCGWNSRGNGFTLLNFRKHTNSLKQRR